MGLLDDIVVRLKQAAEKAPGLKNETVGKIKKVGESSLEITRDILQGISDKVSDITALTRLQYNIKELEEKLAKEKRNLGKLGFRTLKSEKTTDNEEKDFLKQVEKVGQLKAEIAKQIIKYEKLKKEHSDNYVIQKLSDELTDAGAIIDQAVVSEKSNVAGKLLKEILLPKEALISAIKRGEEVIIPDGNTQFLAGDLVTVFGKEEDVQKVIKRLSAS